MKSKFRSIYILFVFLLIAFASNDVNGYSMTSTPFDCTLIVTVSTVDVNCANSNDGSATATATGGSSQYNYNWSTGGTGMTEINLAPGTYTVTVSDSNNCSAPEEFTIGVNDNVFPTVLTQNIDAFLGADGSVDIMPMMVDGGSSDNCGIASMIVTPPTLYCDNLGAQSVELIVTDMSGNIASNTATVNVLDTIVPTSNCNFNPILDPCTGLLIYDLPTFNDNCAPLMFVINGPLSGSILPIGTTTISFIVTDNSGNTTTCNVDVINDAQLSIAIEGTDVFCNGNSTGSAFANVTGINPGFTYFWNTGDTTQQIDNLPAGVYSVVVTDNAGCDTNAEVILTEPDELVITDVIVTDESAPGQSDGSIALTVNGGIPPYSFQPTPTDLPSGTYVINVMDTNGCVVATQEITVGTMVSNEDVLLEKNVQLFPNPSSGQIYLDFTLPESMEVMVRLYDVTGKLLWERPSEFISQEEIELEVSSLSNGLYFVQIQADERVSMKRFILQKK